MSLASLEEALLAEGVLCSGHTCQEVLEDLYHFILTLVLPLQLALAGVFWDMLLQKVPYNTDVLQGMQPFLLILHCGFLQAARGWRGGLV